MIRALGLLAGLIAFPWVCYHCVPTGGPVIQSTLQSIVAHAESTASIAGVQVAADGREITLTGTVPTEEMRVRAGAIAMALPGVRTVDNRITVVAPPAPTPPPPAQAAVAQAQINQILLDKRIQFETARDVLLPVSIPVLQEVASVLAQAPQLSVTI